MPVTRNLSILLTDIKGFTDRTSHQTRADIQALLDEHRSIVLPILEGGGGKLIKTIGDAFLMTFESPTDSVLAGVAVQDALRRRNAGRAEGDRIEVRIAINSGEVNISEGDIFGEPVNITSRIEGVAEAGEVFFTEAVYLAMNKTEVPSSLVDKYRLKGIAEEVKVYKVRRETQVGSGDVPPARVQAPERGPKAVAVGSSPEAAPDAPAPSPASAAPAVPPRNWVLSRVAATVVDLVLISVAHGLLFHRPPHGLRFAIPWFVMNMIFLKRWSATPGMRIVGLKVVRFDGRPLEKRDRLVRSGATLLSLYSFGLGYLWAFFEKDRRGWHDLLAGTRVAEQ